MSKVDQERISRILGSEMTANVRVRFGMFGLPFIQSGGDDPRPQPGESHETSTSQNAPTPDEGEGA